MPVATASGYHRAMNRDRLTVIIAAYNEVESLPLLQPRIVAVLDALAGEQGIDDRLEQGRSQQSGFERHGRSLLLGREYAAGASHGSRP